MCGPSDNSGEIAAKEERRRQKGILQGQSSVNAAFLPFDDAFYKGREKAFSDYYLPQLDLQTKGARGDLLYDLGRKGTVDSSEGSKEFANLQGTYDNARKGIIEGAHSYGQQTKASLEGQRGQLLRDVETGAGVGSAGAGAASTAQLATLPPAFSPLGDLFSRFTSGAANNEIVRSGGGAGNSFYNSILSLLPGYSAPTPKYSLIGA